MLTASEHQAMLRLEEQLAALVATLAGVEARIAQLERAFDPVTLRERIRETLGEASR